MHEPEVVRSGGGDNSVEQLFCLVCGASVEFDELDLLLESAARLRAQMRDRA